MSSKKSAESLSQSMKKGLADRTAGLASMFGKELATPVAVPLEDDTYEIGLDHIQPDPNQPRKVFDKTKLNELAASIRERGVQSPINVYETAAGSYTIISGERRYRAAKIAGLETVPCRVRGRDYDRTLIDLDQLIENVQRADLEPIEAARALRDLMKKHELSQVQAAKRIGKPRTWLAELVSILKIDKKLLDSADGIAKRVLVEIAREPEKEHKALLKTAKASDSPLSSIQEKRTTKKPRTPRPPVYRERFELDGKPDLEIKWHRDPSEVDASELAAALQDVARQVEGRAQE